MIGSDILIKKGEVIPLDGILKSTNASIDESSVTGEPYPQDHVQGNIITSGTVNIGETIVITVTRLDADSTYNQIIQLVASAQEDKSPFIRLADRYSVIFTIIALSIA
jgi:P-type E1-E2 ATPase